MNHQQHVTPADDLSRQFQQAAERVSALEPEAVTPQMHTLYGLYKQATSGDHDSFKSEIGREEHDNPDGPVGLSQGQWEAWSQCKGMSRQEAMRRYVEEAGKLAETPAADAAGRRPVSSWMDQGASQTASGQAPPAPEGWGTEAGAASAGLHGDLRAGAPYGSEEERKDEEE